MNLYESNDTTSTDKAKLGTKYKYINLPSRKEALRSF